MNTATFGALWVPALGQDRTHPGDLIRFSGSAGTFGLQADDLRRGIFLPGATRSGKTTVLCQALAALRPRLGPGDALVIFDPRGDYVGRFYRPGDLVVDPRPARGTGAWNLFRDLDPGDDYALQQSSSRIAGRLFSHQQNQLTPFFTTAPRRLLESVLYVLGRQQVAAGRCYSNRDLVAFSANLTPEALDWVIRNSPAPGELASYLGDATAASDQALGVLGEYQAAVAKLRPFARHTGMGVGMADFVRTGGGRACFLQYDASAPDTQDEIWGLMVDLALSAALETRTGNGRLYLVLDELPLLGRQVDLLERALNFGAGQHVGGILCAAQSLAQLEDRYGPAKTQALTAGFGTVVGLRPNDAATRTFLQQRCGTVFRPVQYARCGILTATVQQTPLLPDDQMLAMGVGDAIVAAPPEPPFAFHFSLDPH